MLSDRIGLISDSPTLAVSAMAREMKSRGIDVVDFGAGQPDFSPPEHVKQAAVRAAHENAGYTPASGLPELRKAVCEKLRKENSIEYSPEEVIISVGAKHALYNAFQALLNPGDEVIIPVPYWVSYPDMVRLAGGTPVFAQAGRDFTLSADHVTEEFSQRTKALVINSPNNPSGAVFPGSEIKKAASAAAEKGILIISDEIYEKMVYEGRHTSPASMSEEIKNMTVTVNGLSKSHAIPGWRLGYAAGPGDVIKAMGKLQSQSTSNPSSISQRAAMAGLEYGSLPEGILEEYGKRRDLVVQGLNSIEGLSCATPRGAFYAFPRVDMDMGKGTGIPGMPGLGDKEPGCTDDVGFSRMLLEKAGVAVVPGSAFGMPGHIRISYATSQDRIAEGLERIRSFMASF